jgi:hypothetical protein
VAGDTPRAAQTAAVMPLASGVRRRLGSRSGAVRCHQDPQRLREFSDVDDSLSLGVGAQFVQNCTLRLSIRNPIAFAMHFGRGFRKESRLIPLSSAVSFTNERFCKSPISPICGPPARQDNTSVVILCRSRSVPKGLVFRGFSSGRRRPGNMTLLRLCQ